MNKNPPKIDPNKPKIISNDSVPNEVKIIRNILKEMDIEDYDQNIIPQLLDFSYNYTSEILNLSKNFSRHRTNNSSYPPESVNSTVTRNKLNDPNINLADVQLACRTIYDIEERKSVSKPNNFRMAEYAKSVNSKGLTKIGNNERLPLPADKYCVYNSTYERRDLDQVASEVERSKRSRMEEIEDVMKWSSNQN